jgi:hypothetical protein
MSRLTVRCIRAAMLALAAGILLGVAFALDRSLGARLRPLHAELNLWGWSTLLIYGVGYHMLPRFCGRPLARPRLAEAQGWLAIGGVAAASLGWLLSLAEPLTQSRPQAGRMAQLVSGAPAALLAAGGLAQLAAALIFVSLAAALLRPGAAGPSC